MSITDDEVRQFEQDGFLVLPGLISEKEVELLKSELDRVCRIDDERIVRERAGGPRMVYGIHDCSGPVGSKAYDALTRSPRILNAVKKILKEDVYVYHTKANTKEAIDGAIYEWHQDYTNWNIMDGTPKHDILTVMVMLDESTELGGCLYFVPGSHKYGIIKPDVDEDAVAAAIQRVVDHGEPMRVPKDKMIEIVREKGEPVPIVGKPGTVAIFHGDMVHGSGHNMSIHSRWILYIVYSTVSNTPQEVPKPRKEYKAARHAPIAEATGAGSILEFAD